MTSTKNKHRSAIQIRFSDIDAMGHVNNAVYLSYFEQARMSFFEHRVKGEWDWKKDGIILARNEVDYRLPLLLKDIAYIDTWIEKMGTKSMDIAYNIYKQEGEQEQLCASGASVIVAFDFTTGRTTAIPEIWRELLG